MMFTAEQATCIHLGVNVLIVSDPEPWRGHEGIVPLYTRHWCFNCDRADENDCHACDKLVGRGSIEVVPVVESFASGAGLRIDGQVGIWLWDGTNAPIFMGRADAPLPVPGRDFGIVIDCVEVAGG